MTILKDINKKILICDMARPQESNIEAKIKEKIDKYQQLALQIRENRLGHCIDGKWDNC